MLDTSARLLQLLGLLQVRPEWSGADLAERLGVTVRTLRRDVQRLRDLDYPVHSVPGVAGGYRLGSGRALPPLLLNDDEAIAVVVSLRSAASQSVAGLSEASVSALAKLDQVLPARLRERTAALQQATVALTGPGPVVDPEALAALAAACRRHQRLRLSYRNRSGSESKRIVEPHRLVSTGYRWYLMAFDVERGEWRTFRVDRIAASAEAGGRFVPRESPDPAAFVARAVTSAPYRYQARILVHAPAQVVAEEFSRTSGVVTDAGPDECLLTTGADSLNLLTFHLAALGADFTVLEPQELIDFVRVTAEQLAHVAQRSEDAAGHDT
ncbi:MAG: YafY family transcriptional regulator [Nocardiopsaceae bacterium]|nr:YafY family transcriptional regulator [Nocardiopsaceae bacterium]